MGRYRILTFDGGGIRGALSITLISRLHERFPDFVKSTDLFAGHLHGIVHGRNRLRPGQEPAQSDLDDIVLLSVGTGFYPQATRKPAG